MGRSDFLVIPATSKTGREVCAALEAMGHQPLRAVRSPRNPDEVRLDLTDPATWDEALTGISGIFLLRPPHIADIDKTLGPFIERARAWGVHHIVFLSVMGADKNRFLPHAAVERVLMAGPEDWTILRPGFFAQNLEDPYLQDIREDDRLYLPAGSGQVAFVDLRDVGYLSALCMANPPDHLGKAYTLTGPEAVGFDAVAEALSAALHRPIRYDRASIPGYVRHLRRRGAPWGLVAVQTYLHVGLRWGQAEAVDPTLGRLLARKPNDIFDYIAADPAIWAKDAGGAIP